MFVKLANEWGLINEDTEAQKGDLPMITELEDLELKVRQTPGSSLETLYHLSPPLPPLNLGLSSRKAHLWEDKQQPTVTDEKKPASCPGQHPREWAGVWEASWAIALATPRALRKVAGQPSLRGSAPACSRGHRQQEKTDWNGNPAAVAKEASSPCPPGLSPSASWTGRKGQAGPIPWLTRGLRAAELEIRGKSPSFWSAPYPLSS